MSKYDVKLTLQLTPLLTSIGSISLPVWKVLLPVSTVLLLVKLVVSSSEIVATILGRGEVHVTPTITSSSTQLEGRTIAIKS